MVEIRFALFFRSVKVNQQRERTWFAGVHEEFMDELSAETTGFRLLRMSVCANLDFCAVVRPERECVCAWLRKFQGFRAVSAVGRAGVAQLVEHLICNQRVGGSNPFASSTYGTGKRVLRRQDRERLVLTGVQGFFPGCAGPVLRGDPTEVHMLRNAGGSPGGA